MRVIHRSQHQEISCRRAAKKTGAVTGQSGPDLPAQPGPGPPIFWLVQGVELLFLAWPGSRVACI